MTGKRPNPAVELVRAYAAMILLLPVMRQAIEAEWEAPGYGADATVLRWAVAQAEVPPDRPQGFYHAVPDHPVCPACGGCLRCRVHWVDGQWEA